MLGKQRDGRREARGMHQDGNGRPKAETVRNLALVTRAALTRGAWCSDAA
jgi:hypothetical protein